jgi:hypothetical protein
MVLAIKWQLRFSLFDSFISLVEWRLERRLIDAKTWCESGLYWV